MQLKAILSVVAGTVGLVATAVLAGQAQAPEPAGVPTFARDIAPILYANCASCHRPGEIAPMSLLTYAEARPWAQAIGRRVAQPLKITSSAPRICSFIGTAKRVEQI